jgi:hypothetical protein
MSRSTQLRVIHCHTVHLTYLNHIVPQGFSLPCDTAYTSHGVV